VKFDEAERRVQAAQEDPKSGAPSLADPGYLEALYGSIRQELEKWLQALPAHAPARERAERLGLCGASEKRIGNLFPIECKKAKAAYERAREFYKRALEADPSYDWVITQYLSMTAVMAASDVGDALVQEYGSWWSAARQIANWQLRTASGVQKAWALATLAELELLGVIYDPQPFDIVKTRDTLVRLCRELCDVVDKDAFAVASTRRQFLRYLQVWPRDLWNDLAKRAVETLPDRASWIGHAYLGPDA
jgi:tetratricopeptide (TPR) repeat protein